MQHFSLFNNCWLIRMLVTVARYPRKWSEDFMTSSNDFYAFHRFAGLQSQDFFLKLNKEQYFKSLANKSNSQESPFLHFLQFDPKEVRVLTNIIFFSFGLADDQKPFNVACNNIFFNVFAPLWIPLSIWNAMFSFF